MEQGAAGSMTVGQRGGRKLVWGCGECGLRGCWVSGLQLKKGLGGLKTSPQALREDAGCVRGTCWAAQPRGVGLRHGDGMCVGPWISRVGMVMDGQEP